MLGTSVRNGFFLYLLHLKIGVKVEILGFLELGLGPTELGRKKKKLSCLLLIVPKTSVPILNATLTLTHLTTKVVA